MVARNCGDGEMESSCLMGIDFQFRMMKKVLEIDSGDDCTTM